MHVHGGETAPVSVPSSRAVGRLDLGRRRLSGLLAGQVRSRDAVVPLDDLILVGPGMHRVPTINAGEGPPLPESPLMRALRDEGYWSRTIGALGGEDIWQRLVDLRVGIVGCSRSGSLVALALARLGVRDLTLIDPDVVEVHQLGEMEAVSESDIGQPKAVAVADHLRQMLGQSAPALTTIVADLTRPVARTTAQACDVLFCCVDNDAGRLLAALLSTLYHKVLIDIGTGIHFPEETTVSPDSRPTSNGNSPRSRLMGADVRMIIPGSGCLLCLGHLAHYAEAVDELCCNRPSSRPVAKEQWRAQRAGSLRSLNESAVAAAVQMLEDLVAERIETSTWLHLEVDQAGRLSVRYPEFPPSATDAEDGATSCKLCIKAGLGDGALHP
jgi:hypothetical protein